MHYVVIGVDGPEFGSDAAVDGKHQAYMDRWLSSLVARGPTLDPGGRRHTGSVHVVDVRDDTSAEHFADEEPYARAGWYSDVSVARSRPCLGGTMWDRPAPIIRQTAALVTLQTGDSAPASDVARILRRRLGAARRPWLYVGVTGDDTATGLVALLEAGPADAAGAVSRLVSGTALADAGPVAQRWRRGGRYQGRSGALLSRWRGLTAKAEEDHR